jgi:cold shock CspA family protein
VLGTSFDQLREGQRVSFDEEPDTRDPSRRRAVNVTLVDSDDGA